MANPIDLLGSANAATYELAIGPILADPNIDAVIALFVPPVVEDPHAVQELLPAAPRSPTSRCSPS